MDKNMSSFHSACNDFGCVTVQIQKQYSEKEHLPAPAAAISNDAGLLYPLSSAKYNFKWA